MNQLVDLVLIVALALNFIALSVSRIRAVINAVALQGLLLGSLPVFVHPSFGWRGVPLVVVTMVLKGIVFPDLLVRAMREADI